MELTEFLQIAGIGGGITLIVELIKTKLNLVGKNVQLLSLVLAIIGGIAFYFLQDTNFLVVTAEILAFATVIYEFILKKIK
jgi:hypothetical protein